MFKDNLRKIRCTIGMTQEELGTEVGLNKKTISAYELGSRAPSLTILADLVQVLNKRSDIIIDYNRLLEKDDDDM